MGVSFAMVLALLLPCAAAGHGGLRFVTVTQRNATLGEPDSLGDELVDQANPNFEKISKGDGCISFEELYGISLSRIPEGPDRDELAPKVKELTKPCFEAMDTSHDGCIDELEFKEGGAGASPPPNVPSEVEVEMRKVQFEAMDQNNDHRISRPEAYDFVADLEHASVSNTKVDAVFNAADTDFNKFLSEDEFLSAGQKYKGDGPGAFFLALAPNMSTLDRVLTFVVSRHKHSETKR